MRMSGFRPRHGTVRRGRRLLVLSFALIVLGNGIWDIVQGRQASERTKVSDETQSAPVRITSTNLKWQGKPVYRLTNVGPAPLHRVTVENTSETYLRVLSIGTTYSEESAATLPSASTYLVNHAQALWFVGSSEPPARFLVAWEASGKRYFAWVNSGAGS